MQRIKKPPPFLHNLMGERMGFYMHSYRSALITFLFLVLTPSGLFAQTGSAGIGAYVGAGTINGNSPSMTSFSANIFLDYTPGFTHGTALRLGVLYARKIEVLLPSGLYDRYYPFVKGVSLKAVINQVFRDVVYTEEAIGPLLLNDRIFSDVNKLDVGLCFSFLAGLDLRDTDNTGFKSGIGIEYGLTFTNTSASYFSIHLQGQYYFLPSY